MPIILKENSVKKQKRVVGSHSNTDPEYTRKIHMSQFGGREVLGKRELTVLFLIVDGNTTNDIAGLLKIHPSTVEVHRRNIYLKLRPINPSIDCVASLVCHVLKPLVFARPYAYRKRP